jgi:phosphate transport system permease protein
MTLKRRLSDGIAKSLIWLCAFLTVAALLWLVGYIMAKGLPHISWAFLTTPYESPSHGISSMIITTLYIIGLTLLFAAPIGIFAAIYLVEYAKPGKLVSLIRFTTESLSGIPSILFGLFGYIFFVNILHFRYSLLAGALTLALTVLPTIIRTTEESLKTVPLAYKEGSLALGASKLYTLFRVMLPSALPGIITALILSIGRIVGETAAVFMTAGMVYRLPQNVMDSGRTLAVHLYALANEGTSFDESYATAAVLIIMVLLINIIANMMGKALLKKIRGT